MKTLIKTLLVIIPVLLTGCDAFEGGGDSVIPRGQSGYDTGIIYGYDMTECGCCGGYMITINNKNYKFWEEDISGPNVLALIDVTYPLSVKLRWSLKTGNCATGERIVVHELHLAN